MLARSPRRHASEDLPPQGRFTSFPRHRHEDILTAKNDIAKNIVDFARRKFPDNLQ